MQQIWSPWRSEHISTFDRLKAEDAGKGTLFSRLLEEDDDEKNLIVYRGEKVFVIMNLYPYNNGHLMILPVRPVADLQDLDMEEQCELIQTVSLCMEWLTAALKPEGFNVGMNIGAAAGAGVPTHLHVHVVPRWSGDTNFMPTIAEIKVVPESMRETYRKLRAVITSKSHEG